MIYIHHSASPRATIPHHLVRDPFLRRYGIIKVMRKTKKHSPMARKHNSLPRLSPKKSAKSPATIAYNAIMDAASVMINQIVETTNLKTPPPKVVFSSFSSPWRRSSAALSAEHN